MTKYQKCVQEMMEEHKVLFTEFKQIHDGYAENARMWQELFNKKGEEVMRVCREWERRLCSYSEQGQYGKFSSNLADKFWSVIRMYFPKIDFVGVKS